MIPFEKDDKRPCVRTRKRIYTHTLNLKRWLIYWLALYAVDWPEYKRSIPLINTLIHADDTIHTLYVRAGIGGSDGCEGQPRSCMQQGGGAGGPWHQHIGGHHGAGAGAPSGQRKCSYEFQRLWSSGVDSSGLERRGRGDARTLDGCWGGFDDIDDLDLRSRSWRSLGVLRLLSKLADEYSSGWGSIIVGSSASSSTISPVGIHLKSSSRRVELSNLLFGVRVR